MDFRFDGVRYRKRSPDNTVSGAKIYETVLRHKLASGEPIERKEKKELTFKEFSDDWFETYVKNNNKHSEILTKEMVLRVHLVPHFGRMPLENISSLEIEKCKAKKLKEGLCPKSVNNHISVLRTSLQCALEWNAVKACPIIRRLKTPPSKYDFLTTEESSQLIDAAEGIWREMIKIALGTGLRFGELIALTWNDVDFEKDEFTIRRAFAKNMLGSPKSNRIRYIPMTESVYQVLSSKLNREGYVFADGKGQHLKQIPCLKKLHRICKKAGLRKIGWHCFRHTFASHLAQAGANLVAVQGLLGHSDIRTTMRYTHINDAVLREAINILDLKDNEESKNFSHNVVTTPKFAVKRRDILKSNSTDISAEESEKRAEALFSNL